MANLVDGPEEDVIWGFPNSVVLLGPWQYYQGYCLVVLRQHASELFQLSRQVRQAYLEEITLSAQALADCFAPRKLNYELLGNQVPHLHCHLFPRYENDPDHLKPVWLAIDRADEEPTLKTKLQTSRLGRRQTATLIRTKLQELVDKQI